MMRRWESVVTGFLGTQPFEHRIGLHFTRATAEFRVLMEPSPVTVKAVGMWNTKHPEERLHSLRWRAQRR